METLDLSTPAGRAALEAALGGREKKLRRARGEGTGSRTTALDALSRAGWYLIGYTAARAVWYAERYGTGERREAGDYDALLDGLLKETRGR